MLNQEVELALNKAIHLAQNEKHEYVSLEHLLHALLSIPAIGQLCDNLDLDHKNIQEELMTFLKGQSPQGQEEKPEFTIAVHRVLQRALIQVQNSGKKSVLPENILLSILEEKNSHARYYFLKSGLESFE